jgi:hypothetical protein
MLSIVGHPSRGEPLMMDVRQSGSGPLPARDDSDCCAQWRDVPRGQVHRQRLSAHAIGYHMGMKAERRVLSPQLDAWSHHASPVDHATAIVRIGPSVDPTRAATLLCSLGLEVSSAGPSSIVGEATPAVLHHIAEEPWVLSVEEPRRLQLS